MGSEGGPGSGIHPSESFAEVALPAFRKGGNLQSALYRLRVPLVVPFRDIEAGDFCDGDGVWVAGKRFDLVAGGHFALTSDGKVETGASAGEKAPDHVVGLKANAEFV